MFRLQPLGTETLPGRQARRTTADTTQGYQKYVFEFAVFAVVRRDRRDLSVIISKT